MDSITLQAYAKINLSLEVLGRRPDGYHDILSFMQDLSISDIVTVSCSGEPAEDTTAACGAGAPETGDAAESRGAEIPEILLEDGCFIGPIHVEFCMDNDTIPRGRENLAIRGAACLIETLERGKPVSADLGIGGTAGLPGCEAERGKSTLAFPEGIRIDIRKRLPVAAGIAGGSGNAAAVMLALDALLGYPLSLRELMAAGASVGADVPFSLMMNAAKNREVLTALPGIEEASPAALMRGIGELVEPKEPVPMTVILMNPGIPVSTREVYQAIDAIPDRTFSDALYYNVMERYTLERYPVVRRMKEAMMEHLHADAVVMSGSGPTVAACYSDRDTAANDYEDTLRAGWPEPDWKIWLAESGGKN